ncbi:hypothetical protein IKS38_06175 [bacterium]|nr:hypothetical protein [bacterium]
MKKQLFFVAAIGALLNPVFLLAENITIARSNFGDTSVWEYVSNPSQYQEEKSHWGVLTELNEHTADEGVPFWGIGGLAKNSEGKSYYHTLSFLPRQIVGATNVTMEFSYFAEGLDSGENIQWCLFCDTTNLFGSLTKSRLDTSNEWETVSIPVPGDADSAGMIFRIKQQGASDYAGIGNLTLKGEACQERGAFPNLSVTTANWDRVEIGLDLSEDMNLLCRSANKNYFVTNRPQNECSYEVGAILGRTEVVSVNESSFCDSNVAPGSTYYYKAWGCSPEGYYSCGSQIKEVTVPELPVIDVAVPSVEAGTLNDETAVLLRPEVDEKLTVLVDVATSRDFLPNPGLFFSEYGKGSGNNRYLEIYNPCPEDVELDGMNVCIFKNGSVAASQTLSLFGPLPSFETLLICNNKADAELTNVADIVSAKIDFTGNDAVALIKGDEILDIIGVIGEDPGTAWPIGEYATGTANHTIIRYPYVNRGSSVWRSKEWEVLEKDFFNDLKNHECSETREGTIVYEALSVPEDGLALTNLSVGKLYYLRAKTAYKGATGAYGGVCGPFQLIPEPGALLLLVLLLLGASSLRSFPL